MSLPLTPVVGYLRAETPADAEPPTAAMDEYAKRAGLVICQVNRESAGATDATLPAFARCLEMVRAEQARGIVLPTWVHLAPNVLLGTALIQALARDRASIYVADERDVPDWAAPVATAPHQVMTAMHTALTERP